MGDTMLVRCEFSVEISKSAWEANFGTVGDRDIRKDVKTYVEGGAVEQIRTIDCAPEPRDYDAEG